jgi:GTP-binding protein HflX
MMTGTAREVSFILPLSDGRRIAWLHAHGEVLAEEDAGEGEGGPQRRVTVRLNPKELGQFSTIGQ